MNPDNDQGWLETRFQENRGHLKTVAFRMLGSSAEAEDAVQEAWIRLSRSDVGGVENLGGWLTTVVARVCLDMLRSRATRREVSLRPELTGPTKGPERSSDPADEALLAEAVGRAGLLVLETLAPAERVAFVLHDLFDLPFGEIAAILRRSEESARQLASRARRRVREAGSGPDPELGRRREVVGAFVTALRTGDVPTLLALLDPEVVLRADETAVQTAAANQGRGAPSLLPEIRGAGRVAETFKGRAQALEFAFVDGDPAATWAPGGNPRVVFAFQVRAGMIVGIEVVMEPARLGKLDVEVL